MPNKTIYRLQTRVHKIVYLIYFMNIEIWFLNDVTQVYYGSRVVSLLSIYTVLGNTEWAGRPEATKDTQTWRGGMSHPRREEKEDSRRAEEIRRDKSEALRLQGQGTREYSSRPVVYLLTLCKFDLGSWLQLKVQAVELQDPPTWE